MLSDNFQSVLQADSEDAFRQEIVRFAEDLGFTYVSALTVVDHSANSSEFLGVDNAPHAFEQQLANFGKGRADPVMQHCKRGSVPIVWDRATYLAQDMSDVWEEQAAFGYRTGIALALHFPEGRHFVMGVDRDQPLPADRYSLTRIVADLQLFAVHAQDAALRIYKPRQHQGDRPKLTKREAEALKWTMEGKTAYEVGCIMSISERTAVMHLQNAMHKLECVSKHQAVIKAMQLGLI